MPYIDIRVGASLTGDQKSRLFETTTDLMNVVMRKKRAVTVVHINESANEFWSINGCGNSESCPVSAFVDIKVTQGSNTPEEKAEMIARTSALLKETVGELHEASYVVIHEIPADSWGYDGLTQQERLTKSRAS